ncbi:hypothetical protein N665_0982s0004 [Sinapis alba]|nr:hypothetical protein N665_0982s0004 [Sinapis alba]
MTYLLRCLYFPSKCLKFSYTELQDLYFFNIVQYISCHPISRFNHVFSVLCIVPAECITSISQAYGQTLDQRPNPPCMCCRNPRVLQHINSIFRVYFMYNSQKQ